MGPMSPIREILFILTLFSGTLGWKPKMDPALKELVVNEGELLELKCFSTVPMIFFYPQNLTYINTSIVFLSETNDEDGNYIYDFWRPKTISGDTGWYGCAEEDVSLPKKSEMGHNPLFNWIYVYVKSENHLFVPESDLDMLHVFTGQDAVVPCRPTSPDFNVTISHANTKTISQKIQSTFDPRIGFTLRNPKVKDGDHYICTATFNDSKNEEISIFIHVTPSGGVEDLKITSPSPRYMIRGQDLRINCTASLSHGIVFQMKWFGPSRKIINENDSRRPIKNYTNYLGTGHIRHIAELNILNVTEEDSGIYYCEFRTIGLKEEEKTVLKVHDPNKKFISISSDDLDRRHILKETEKVKWIVYIHAHPPPRLRWKYSLGINHMQTIYDGHKLSPFSDYNIINNPELTETIFSIGYLKLEHTGNYTLEASNEDGNQTITFTLYVKTKPRNDFKVQAYYAPNQLVEIGNEVDAYPSSNVIWNYINCPRYPSRDDCYTENNLNWTLIKDSLIKSETRVSFRVKMTGILTCLACNELGCDQAREVIFVSDGNHGFGIIKSEGQFTVGDDVEITCTASIYNYTNYFQWKTEDELLMEDDRVQITYKTTEFTHRSTLLIRNLQKSDEAVLTCIGKANDKHENKDYYSLVLVDPKPARIVETNMNGTELFFDLNVLNVLGHKTIKLTCEVTGFPEPTITWYKDDSRIEINNQYLLIRNKQELQINYLLDGDSGKYMCETENRFAKDRAFLMFTVKGNEISKTWIIAFVVLLILCCLLMIFFCMKIRRERKLRKELMVADYTHFKRVSLGYLNDELLPFGKKSEIPMENIVLGKND